MSGDVQPRKRKDKKKKREDDDVKEQHQGVHKTKMGEDDIHLHVHSDHGTGGHWCAKIFFFALLAILIGLTGIIILENQDQDDVDTPLSESRFSNYFEGWVDEHRVDDHAHDPVIESIEDHDDEHDEPFDEEEDHSELEDSHNDHEDEDEDEDEDVAEDEEEEDEELTEEATEEQPTHEDDEEDEEVLTQEQSQEDDGEEGEEEGGTQEDEDDGGTQEDDENDEGDNQDDDNDDEDIFDVGEEDNDDEIDESNPKVVDNDAEELELLKEKARQQEEDDDEDDEDTTSYTASAKVKGGGPQNVDDEDDDDDFKKEFQHAEEYFHKQKYQEALEIFERLTIHNPDRPQSFHGKARSLDALAELHQSNHYLKEAIKEYKRFLAFKEDIEDEEFLSATQRCVERMQFLGHYLDAANIQKHLIERFPNVSDYRNQLAISYLSVNRLPEAKRVLHETLLKWRHDGVALVHYGFVCKALDNNCTNAVTYLREGLETEEEGTQDARFYFNLGDCLQRLGRLEEAREIFKKGAEKKMFLSEYQRSLYNVDNLKAQPFWTKQETTYSKSFAELEKNWEKIKEEGLRALNSDNLFQSETENLKDKGDWGQFDLFMRGLKIKENCAQAPITCGIIESFPEARLCKRGQVKFSVMHPGTHVWPHCGPTNCRLRAHLGLVVPTGTAIRVREEERTWEEGKFLIFDDSFEHEVWHNGSSFRLVLIVDIWHPDLTKEQRIALSPI